MRTISFFFCRKEQFCKRFLKFCFNLGGTEYEGMLTKTYKTNIQNHCVLFTLFITNPLTSV